MPKFLITSLLTLYIFGASTEASFALETPKPNQLCSNLGYFGISNGQMMTCVQSDSKTFWKLENNVIAGGLCTGWVPGDTQTWAELQLFIDGTWKTQLFPIAFTPGPPCDTSHKSYSSIPWIALPQKITPGTKYRWVKGTSGKDGHGGREFGKGYADPTFTYSTKMMKSAGLKVYTAIVPPVEGPHVYTNSKQVPPQSTPVSSAS